MGCSASRSRLLGVRFAERTELFDELIHGRISRFPDAYTLKKRYVEVVEG